MKQNFEKLKQAIREVPNFPKPGINFYDITTLLKEGKLLVEVVNGIADRHRKKKSANSEKVSPLKAVVGIESRGFILGAAVAHALEVGFVPVRKFGKLPAAVARASYSLEYGTDSVEIHRDALAPGDEVIVVDDLLATGGTARATAELVTQLGASIREFLFLIELVELNGRRQLEPASVFSLLQY